MRITIGGMCQINVKYLEFRRIVLIIEYVTRGSGLVAGSNLV